MRTRSILSLALGTSLLLASCARPERTAVQDAPDAQIAPPMSTGQATAPTPVPMGGPPVAPADVKRVEQERHDYAASTSLADRQKFARAFQRLSEADRKAIGEIVEREQARGVGALSSSELDALIMKEVLRRAGTFPVEAQGNPLAELNQLEHRLLWTEPPWVVVKMDIIRRDALRRSENLFTLAQRNRGVGDAWRHMYWNARMRQEYSMDRAREWSWAHDCLDRHGNLHNECEYEVEGAYWWTRGQERNFRYYTERDMDIRNNYTGQWFGHYNMSATPDYTAAWLKYYAELGNYGSADIWKIEPQDGSVGRRVYILGDQRVSPCGYAMWNAILVPSKRDVREFWCVVKSSYQRPGYVAVYDK